ncbi:TPA: efflux RND transporter periplasmic adaptor subunit [Candidatus Avigastranaerophilus faecigallinarum]|nr:efflux RND transporter periplasmic adaptor subunit [Candidatus Avigastranaerophilus faecigallinarum]
MGYLKNKKHRVILFLIVFILGSIGYRQISSWYTGYIQAKAAKIPKEVQIMNPVKMDVYSKSESAGRVEAKYSVDIVARINGWLEKSYFKEGDKVKKGQLLFLIEPDQYQNLVNTAAANVRQAQATLINAEKELTRAKELVKNDYVSKSYYDQALATRDTSKAALDAAKVQLADAKLNLSYTKIVSPVDGKIGKIIITEGNLVNTQTGPIARVVSNSPIYVLFNLKSSEFLKFKKQGSSKDFSNMEVRLQLADGTMYDEVGKIEYVGNEVDQTTGTIDLRATFQNENELLVPGDFVSVVIKSIEPREALTVPQSAALNDAQGYYVWTVGADNKVVRKNIQVSQEINKNWIVESGLEITDNIVAKGVQSIRMPGQVVKPTPLETEDKSADETK